MTNWTQRDGYRYVDLANVGPGDADPFVLDGLVASTVTLFYGRPKTGKSTLAAAVAKSLAGGLPVIGKQPRCPGKTAIVAGDSGDAINVYGSLLPGVPGVRVIEFSRPPTSAAWGALCGELASSGYSLVVIDNLMAFAPGDINDHLPIRKLADVLEQFNRHGIGVLLIHHVSDHEFSTKPMGNTAIAAMARWMVRFERRGNRLILTSHGNYGPETETVVSAPDGTVNFQVLAETGADELAERRALRSRERSKAKLDRNAEIAAYVSAGHTQREAAERFRLDKSTVSRAVKAVAGG